MAPVDAPPRPAGPPPAPAHVPPAAGPPPDFSGHRKLAVLGLLGGGCAAIAAAGAWLIASGPADHAEHAAGGVRTVARPVGAELQAPIDGGRGGRAKLAISVEAPVGGPAELKAIPAGAPVMLRFSVPAGIGGRPSTIAHRLETSLAAMAGGHGEREGGSGQGDDHHGGARSGKQGGHPGKTAGAREPRSRKGSGRGEYAETIALERRETFLFNRASGELVMPNPGAAVGRAGGDGHADHGHSGPGSGLAATIAGGGFAAAIKLPPGAATAEADPSGRYLAISYPERGTVEVVDLLRREPTGAVAIGGRPRAIWFEPGGDRAWVADEAAGRVVAIDVAARRILGSVPVRGGARVASFNARGTRMLVAGAGTATFVDTARVAALESRPLPVGAATGVDFAPGTARFVVAGDSGRLAALPLDEQNRLGPELVVDVAKDAPMRGVGVARDGRTAVVLNAPADRLSIVDTRTLKVIRTVEAGREPTDVVFMRRFAVVRNAGSPDITWVDLKDQERSNNISLGEGTVRTLTVSPDGREAGAAVDGGVLKLHVMMGRPMVMEQLPNKVGADMVFEHSTALRSAGDGAFEQRTVFARPGQYHVELRLPDGSRAEFELPVKPAGPDVTVRPERARLRTRGAKPVTVRFRVEGAAPAAAEVLGVSRSDAGFRQLRVPARRLADGRYEATVVPPGPGRYQLRLQAENPTLPTGAGSMSVLEATR